MFTCRSDKNAWLGETEDRKIGFFKSEHVAEVLDENVDGRCKNVKRIAFDPQMDKAALSSFEAR